MQSGLRLATILSKVHDQFVFIHHLN